MAGMKWQWGHPVMNQGKSCAIKGTRLNISPNHPRRRCPASMSDVLLLLRLDVANVPIYIHVRITTAVTVFVLWFFYRGFLWRGRRVLEVLKNAS